MKEDFRELIVRFMDDDVMALAAQLAYSLIMAFFPFLIFLLTIVGYSSVKSTDVLASLHSVLPQDTYVLITSTVVEIVDSARGDLLSFSAIITIWVGSSGFRAIIKGLNKAYDQREHRPYWKVVLISILCMFGLVLIIMAAFSFVIFGKVIGNTLVEWLGLSSNFKINWDIFRYIVALIFMILAFAAVYQLTPCKKLGWFEVLPGAAFSTLGWIGSSLLFAYYVNNFSNYSMIYGSIGGVIVLMLWLFISSIVILIGGEINAILAGGRRISRASCK